MKNKFLTIMAVVLAGIATGCSQGEEPTAIRDCEEVTVTLTLTVDNGLSMTSRGEGGESSAPRQLLTWDGQQSINDMRIYVFSSSEPQGEYTYFGGGPETDRSYRMENFDNHVPWTQEQAEAAGQKLESHVLTFTPRLRKGLYYKFLAVGRDDINGLEIPSRIVSYIPWGTKVFGDLNLVVGKTEIHDATLTNQLKYTQYPFVSTEIFSGIATFTDAEGNLAEDYIYIDGKKRGFQKEIMLRRAVAGLWVYVTDIPTTAIDNSGREGFNGMDFHPNELTLHLSLGTNTVNLVSKTESVSSTHGQAMQVGYIDFSNRYGQSEAKSWSKSGDSPYWQREEISKEGVNIAANCALISNYLLPVDLKNVEGQEATLTLQLREYETDYVYTRRVKCHINSVTDPVTGETVPYRGNDHNFPIIANSLYAIGLPDAPYSLSRVGTRADDSIEMTMLQY